MKDLSQQPGNPTSYIHDHYQELMALAEQDPDGAAQRIVQAAQEMVGAGLSELNFRKLKLRVMKAVQRGSFGVQKYISDYMLKGMGHGTLQTRGANEGVEAIGSLISEDVNALQIEWSRRLIFIEGVLKRYGMVLCRREDSEGFK